MKQKRTKTKHRRVKLEGETLDIMKRQLERFREKFGREPGPTDPIFFDELLTDVVVQAQAEPLALLLTNRRLSARELSKPLFAPPELRERFPNALVVVKCSTDASRRALGDGE